MLRINWQCPISARYSGPLVFDAMRGSVRNNSGWDLPEATSRKLAESRKPVVGGKLQAASFKQQALDICRLKDYIGYRKDNNMDSTIKLINKYDRTLVDVIQWLDSNGHSNTEIRSKVDVMLNFEKQLKQESEMELTKITYVGD